MVSILLDRHCQWNIHVYPYVCLHVESLYICVSIYGVATFTLYICTYNHTKQKHSLSLSIFQIQFIKLKIEVGKSVHYSKKYSAVIKEFAGENNNIS